MRTRTHLQLGLAVICTMALIGFLTHEVSHTRQAVVELDHRAEGRSAGSAVLTLPTTYTTTTATLASVPTVEWIRLSRETFANGSGIRIGLRSDGVMVWREDVTAAITAPIAVTASTIELVQRQRGR